MSELRAPDPTLDAFRRSDESINYVVNIEGWPDNAPSTAHRVHWDGRRDVPRCGAVALSQVSTQAARWFAVPCRDCFPDAPEPGFRRVRCDHGHGGELIRSGCVEDDPYLAWQVRS